MGSVLLVMRQHFMNVWSHPQGASICLHWLHSSTVTALSCTIYCVSLNQTPHIKPGKVIVQNNLKCGCQYWHPLLTFKPPPQVQLYMVTLGQGKTVQTLLRISLMESRKALLRYFTHCLSCRKSLGGSTLTACGLTEIHQTEPRALLQPAAAGNILHRQ